MMNDHNKIIKSFYENIYVGNPLWENLIKNLTVRQAYVFYYSLVYYEKNEIVVAFGIFDLPDKTMVHQALMEALIKQENPSETAQKIGLNAYRVVINDNDLLWINTELRAALWLGYFINAEKYGGKSLLLDLVKSTSKAEFTNRLIHVLDIYGCSLRGNTAADIRGLIDKSGTPLYVNSQSLFNIYRTRYVTNRIGDHKLNWLNKLSEDEIDSILARFDDDKIQVLVGTFTPNNKKDKLELIKASLNIQEYKYQNSKVDESLLRPYSYQKAVGQTKLVQHNSENERVHQSTKERKDFSKLGADEIIILLQKARASRISRKDKSDAKDNRSLTLNKETYSALNALSTKLNATPKKTAEAIIKSVNLEDDNQLSEIDKHISGRRVDKQQPVEAEESVEAEEPVEPKIIMERRLKKKANQKNHAAALLNFKKKQH